MSPILLLIIGALWFTFIGGTIFAYLEKKFDKWGIALAIILLCAVLLTVLAVMASGGGTATMN